MTGKVVSWISAGAVVALSLVLLLAFQTLGRGQDAGQSMPASESEYARALAAYSNAAYDEAHNRFMVLAQRGHADAKSMLGVMYYNGHGVKLDKALAAIWFYQSARSGRAASQLVLGNLFLTGDGVGKNLEEAVFWLLLAEARGSDDVQSQAAAALTRQREQLKDAQWENLQRRVSLWRPVMADHETLG